MPKQPTADPTLIPCRWRAKPGHEGGAIIQNNAQRGKKRRFWGTCLPDGRHSGAVCTTEDAAREDWNEAD